MDLDLHTHTYFSYDCLQSPRRVLATAERRRLDAVAITDHDSFGGAAAALDASDEFDVVCIPGMEIRTDEIGDLLVLFIDEPIAERSLDGVLSEVSQQDGVAILPHPYRKLTDIDPEVVDAVDAVEGLNARSRERDNDRAQELGRTHEVPMTGGSDAHTPFEIGRSRTTVPGAYPRTRDGIRAAIEAGDTGFGGGESPYYLYHGLSVLMEQVKAKTGIRRQTARDMDNG